MSSFAPLAGLQARYDDGSTAVSVTLWLLDGTVTALLDSYTHVSDLPGRLATGGGYDATVGVVAGQWPLHYDATAGVMELSVPDGAWTMTSAVDLTFRWIVLADGTGVILAAVDYGSAQTITSAPIEVYAAESTDIPSSYPALRWRKA